MHLRCHVAGASRGIPGHGTLDGGEVVGIKLHGKRCEGFNQSIAAACTQHRHDVRPLREHPRNRNLRHADTTRAGDPAQLLNQTQIFFDVAGLESWAVVAEVARRIPVLAPMTADQPARKNAVRGDANPELPTSGKDAVFNATRYQRIFDLQVSDGVHRGGSTQGGGADLGQAYVAHVASLYQLRDGADRLLYWHVRVEAGWTVDVDVVKAE